jgi:hypothetical protein
VIADFSLAKGDSFFTGGQDKRWIKVIASDSTISHPLGFFEHCYVFSNGTTYAKEVGPLNGLIYAVVRGKRYGSISTGIISEKWTSDSNPQIPTLSQNYPNPFNQSTTIEFYLPKSSDVTLKVLTANGTCIGILINKRCGSGIHKTIWNWNGFSSGNYFLVLEAGDKYFVRQATIMK